MEVFNDAVELPYHAVEGRGHLAVLVLGYYCNIEGEVVGLLYVRYCFIEAGYGLDDLVSYYEHGEYAESYDGQHEDEGDYHVPPGSGQVSHYRFVHHHAYRGGHREYRVYPLAAS